MNPRSATSKYHRIPAWAGLVLAAAVFSAQPAAAIPCLSGFVRDLAGGAVAGGDLDFTDSATGQRLVTPGDNTDALGFYNVCVLPGIYDVSFAPPAGTRLMGKLLRNVDLTADVGQELDVVLSFGTVVSGTVRAPGGLVVGNVDVDVDEIGGGRIYTPGDNSDPATGVYRIVVPSGRHRFRFEPLRGSRLRGAEFDSVEVQADLQLDVDLVEGLLLQGRVTDATGQGVFEVDVDLRDRATGAKIYLANKATDPLGDYVVAAPTGEFQLRYAPPRRSHLVAALVDSIALQSDVARDQILQTGFLVDVLVRDADGTPLAGADLDIKDALTGAKLFTPYDASNTAGMAEAVLPPGTYEVAVDPPLGASLASQVLAGITVVADTTIVVDLEEAARVTVTGRVVDELGDGVPDVVFGAILRPSGDEIRLAEDQTTADGSFALALPPGLLEMTLDPPLGSRLVGRLLPAVSVANDSTWGEIVLASGVLVQVQATGPTGLPVDRADLDFIAATTGLEIYTPRDNTDADGMAVAAVPAGDYRLVVTPAAGSGFATAVIEPFPARADTAVVVMLASTAVPAGRVSIAPGRPNPFGESTEVAFRLDAATNATLAIYDLRGRRVRVVTNGPRTAGLHAEIWDGRADGGARVPSGVYVIRLQTGLGDDTRTISVVH